MFNICTPPRDVLPLACVPQHFSLLAFVFHGFWLLYYRAWLPAVAVLMVYALASIAAEHWPAYATLFMIAQLFLQAYVGFAGNEFRVWALQRQGYVHADIIAANNAEEAELRYYQQHRTHSPYTMPMGYA